eukprot:1604141-Pyramimonas_sp.AAC.1
MIPVAMGGKSGVIEFVATEENLPPLLPGSFLDQFGAILDYPRDQLTLKKIGCTIPMEKSGRSHRTIKLND